MEKFDSSMPDFLFFFFFPSWTKKKKKMSDMEAQIDVRWFYSLWFLFVVINSEESGYTKRLKNLFNYQA